MKIIGQYNTALYIKDFKGNYPKFLFYLLQWLDLKFVCSGTGVPTLIGEQVHKLISSIPPLPEQKRIAEMLNEKMSFAGKLSKHLEGQLETTNKLPSALLRKAFNGEL